MATISFDMPLVVQPKYEDNFLKAAKMQHPRPAEEFNHFKKDGKERTEKALKKLYSL